MKSTLMTLGVSFGFLLLCALSMGNRMYLLISLISLIGSLGINLSVSLRADRIPMVDALKSVE